ncbi:uncharacterized protein F5Z01DRAFT_672861 [Emericellopsis atlantica]|uniref:Uncharacterized protein n=1 Tax=Emericellopsis atlantica TaxID=2614577 RepID=A0A9P7ZP69_9HYPO|nr:uncharacterized protein F5Z01DRAFT_672861 [Emericellopsis atlantica]KAG9255551.1 hypothetical protein F5Z01DRAFT_672861 [Emericellopsis atlantica]
MEDFGSQHNGVLNSVDDGISNSEARIRVLEQEKVILTRQAEEVLATLAGKHRAQCKKAKRLESRLCKEATLAKENAEEAERFKHKFSELRDLLDSERVPKEDELDHLRGKVQELEQAHTPSACHRASQTDSGVDTSYVCARCQQERDTTCVDIEPSHSRKVSGPREDSDVGRETPGAPYSVKKGQLSYTIGQDEQFYTEAKGQISQLEKALADKDARYRETQISLEQAAERRLQEQRQRFEDIIEEKMAAHRKELLETQQQAEEYFLELSERHADECEALLQDGKQLEEKYGKLLQEYNQTEIKKQYREEDPEREHHFQTDAMEKMHKAEGDNRKSERIKTVANTINKIQNYRRTYVAKKSNEIQPEKHIAICE